MVCNQCIGTMECVNVPYMCYRVKLWGVSTPSGRIGRSFSPEALTVLFQTLGPATPAASVPCFRVVGIPKEYTIVHHGGPACLPVPLHSHRYRHLTCS
jgi:hypothetical protein